LEKLNVFEISNFQTIDLGDDTAGTYDFLPDTFMNTVSQEVLEFYIRKVLETDHNFTITLGMRIYCEDNYLLYDTDYWDNLRIKSFNLTFTYEKIALFKINYPESGQVFGEDAPQYSLFIVDDPLDTMWYTLDDGITNITFTALTGTINQTEWNKVENGSVTIIFYGNDTLGNLGFTELNIYKDVSKPFITINLPNQNQLFGEKAPQYNLSIVEGNLDTMWYTLDDGINNITFTDLTGTINQTEWNKVENGSLTIIFYVNDTLGNLGFIKLNIYKDISKPLIIINVPSQDQFYGEDAPQYKITIVEGNLDTMWYTLNDGIINITFTALTGTINQTEWNKVENGSLTIIFYVNDTLGNLGFIKLNIYKDISEPLIIINVPSQDQFYGEDAPQYNITIVEGNLDTMWYTLNDGFTNITFTALIGTINQTEWNKVKNGSVTIIFYANDTLGNLGFAELNIFKDVSKPLMTINLPSQDQLYGENAPQYNLSIIEGNLDTMWYTLDDGFTNITFTELTGTINQTEWNKVENGSVTIIFYA